jgi:hypothetical protein
VDVGRPAWLHGVDDVPWSEMSHAFGPAHDVPGLLAGLAARAAIDAHVPTLLELLGDGDADVRANAAYALSAPGGPARRDLVRRAGRTGHLDDDLGAAMHSVGFIRAARRALRTAEKSGSRRRVAVARMRVAVARWRNRH